MYIKLKTILVVTSLTRWLTDCCPPPEPHTLSLRFPPLDILRRTVALSRAALPKITTTTITDNLEILQDDLKAFT